MSKHGIIEKIENLLENSMLNVMLDNSMISVELSVVVKGWSDGALGDPYSLERFPIEWEPAKELFRVFQPSNGLPMSCVKWLSSI